MKRVLLGLAGLGLAGLLFASGDDGPKPSAVALAHGYPPGPYSEAEFSISDDAAVMVLSVQHAGRSMRLYGDGRLDLQRFDRRGAVVASHDRNLPFAEMTELVRLAVDHGFAEWDRDSLDFLGIASRSSHPTVAFGELHLESYQRGEYARDGLDRSFRFGDVCLGLEYSADVLQIQGLKAMQQALYNYFESAEGGAEK